MMKKFTLLLVALMCFSLGQSQSLPFDFEASQPFIGDSGASVSDVDDGSGSNQVLQIDGNGSQWDNAQVTFATPLDLSNSALNTIKFRMRSLDAASETEVNEHLIKFELPENGGDTQKTFTTTGTGWHDIEVDMDLGNVVPPDSYGKMIFMVDWGGGPTTGLNRNYYLDDISIGATTPGTDATLSDLQVDTVTISGFDSSTLDYTYSVANGVTTVPTVTATTNDGGASVIVTPASGVPGVTNIVVTAVDGTTTKTYTVTFGYPIEFPFNFETSQPFTANGVTLSNIDDGSGSNQVLQIVGDGSQWDNAQVIFSTPIDLSDNDANTLRFTFQSTTAGGGEVHQHGVSFQPVGGTASEINFNTTGQTPVDVELDFPDGLGTYPNMLIFVDVPVFGVDGPNGDTGTYILDNITLGATVLGIEDISKSTFKLFPNPTQHSWTVKTQNESISSINVFDVLGKMVLSSAPDKSEAIIDGSNLKPGLYFAQIKTNEGVTSIKLVKN